MNIWFQNDFFPITNQMSYTLWVNDYSNFFIINITTKKYFIWIITGKNIVSKLKQFEPLVHLRAKSIK